MESFTKTVYSDSIIKIVYWIYWIGLDKVIIN